jgi:hypothetical protein
MLKRWELRVLASEVTQEFNHSVSDRGTRSSLMKPTNKPPRLR